MSTGPSNIPPGYDPKCLMCNLRRKPGCIFCYAPGNSIACAEHRTPCGKHSVVEAPAVFESEESPPPKQAPQSHDEKPERRAWSLPKTADGDTLLMLPTDRDIPPGLLNEKRWLIWKAEWDSSGKFKKPPRSPFTGQKIGATEKYLSDFGTFAEARAAAEKFNSSGLGFVFLRGDKRVAIDFDHCIKTIAEEHDVPGGHVKSNSPAINREVWPWLDQWFANTYQEVSPSGDGSHVICLGELPGGKAVTATELPKSNGTHVELYDHDRFLTFTGQRFGLILKDATDSSAAITKLLQYLGSKEPLTSEPQDANHPMSVLTARKLHEANLEALKNAKHGEGNALLNTTAFFAARAFAAKVFETETEESLKKTLLNIVTKGWSAPHPEAGARETIRSGWTSGFTQPLTIKEDDFPEVAAAVEELNKDFFTVAKFGGQFRVCSFDKLIFPRIGGWKQVLEVLVPQRVKDFTLAYMNKLIKYGENRDGSAKIKSKADIWLTNPHRREFTRVVFLPGGAAKPDEYNLWKGFAFEPKAGNCDLYLAHLKDNICQGDEKNCLWLIQWMAWQVRHPGGVGQSAVVVRGEKGTGKNIFAEGFANLWGQHGIVLSDTHSVTTNFNAHLRDKCVVVADEAFFAGDPQQARLLKPLITGSTITIEHKGVDKTTVPNLLRFIIISNDEHVIPATGDERRYFALTCGEKHQKDTQYFGALLDQLNSGGYTALLYHLLREVNLVADFDVHNPPHTEELQEQKTLTVRGAPGVWLEILQAGEIPGPVGKDGTALLNISDLLKWVGEKRKQGRRWNDLTTKDFQDFFGKAMGFERPKSAQKGLYEEKRRYWFIPPLSACRQLWDDKKWTVTWPPNVDDWSGWEMLDKP